MRAARTQQNIESLFEQAVTEHSRRLLTVARAIVGNRFAPEDIVQQALMNLYEHRTRYDWEEPGPLMRRAVVNEALRALRRPTPSFLADDYAEACEPPINDLIERENIEQVRSAIERLPQHYRAALVLCEYENLPYSEIAQVLDATIPQVKTWLHRARRQLARLLQGVFDPTEMSAGANLCPA
jgi:RNA polymerase sigma factor (sigma-70 family)